VYLEKRMCATSYSVNVIITLHAKLPVYDTECLLLCNTLYTRDEVGFTCNTADIVIIYSLNSTKFLFRFYVVAQIAQDYAFSSQNLSVKSPKYSKFPCYAFTHCHAILFRIFHLPFYISHYHINSR